MQEAISKAHTAWAPLTIQAQVQALLDDPAADVDKDSSMFWLMVAALKRFIVRSAWSSLRICILKGLRVLHKQLSSRCMQTSSLLERVLYHCNPHVVHETKATYRICLCSQTVWIFSVVAQALRF
jgi:hypothetical protein